MLPKERRVLRPKQEMLPPEVRAQRFPANGVTQGALPESPRAEDSYFDDAVFIGDSVSLKLNLYVTKNRQNNPPCWEKRSS